MIASITSRLLIAKPQYAAESVAILKGVYLTIWTINLWPPTILYRGHLDIIGGKGAT